MQLISNIFSSSRSKIRDILPTANCMRSFTRNRKSGDKQAYSIARKTFVVSVGVADAINMARAILDRPGNRFVQMGNRQIICLSRLEHSDETIELILSFTSIYSGSTSTAYSTEIDIQSSKEVSHEMIARSYKLIDSFYGMIRRTERKVLSYQSAVAWLISVADNTESEPDVLEEVSNHPDHRVKAAVADNPRSPLSVLFKLALDGDAEIRYQLADNHNAAPPVLEKLAEDRDVRVAQRARRTLSNLSALSHECWTQKAL